jgi:hypothetical protein
VPTIASNVPSVQFTAPRARRPAAGKSIAALASVALFVSVGCEKSPYDLAPVRGTVTVDGQQLQEGKVMFTPVAKEGELNPGKPAFGRIGPDGTFVLSTYGNEDGAIVGEHGVTVVNMADKSVDSGAFKFSRVTLPRKYVVVPGKENEIDINITKVEVAQYGQ